MSDHSARDARAFGRFAARGLAFGAAPALALGLALAWLHATSDAWPMARVLSHEERAVQRGEATLFQRALVAEEMRRYKYEAIRRRAPRIVALGSSTVMQWRARAFGPHADAFYNAGGLIQHTPQLAEFADALPALPGLRTLVVGLDLWWFNANWQPTTRFPTLDALRDAPGWRHDLRARLRALPRLAQALVDREDRARIAALVALPQDGIDGLVGAHAIGLLARNGQGFRSGDGSYRYPEYLAERRAEVPYVDHDEVHARIARGRRKMQPGDFAAARVVHLERLLDACLAHGVTVAGFTTPLARDVVAALAADPRHAALLRDYRAATARAFAARDLPFVDATEADDGDPRSMIGGFHGSEIVAARILRRLLADPRFARELDALTEADVDRLLADPRTTLAQLAPAND